MVSVMRRLLVRYVMIVGVLVGTRAVGAADTSVLPGWSGWRPRMPPAESQELLPEELFSRLAPSVHALLAYPTYETFVANAPVAFGSAVAITPRDLLTNCHVVSNYPYLAVLGPSKAAPLCRVRVTRADPANDRCWLELLTELNWPDPPSEATTGGALCRELRDHVPGVRTKDSLRVGERVYAIGTPEGFVRTLSDGLIAGIRSLGDVTLVQTSAPISHGSSGGALFDRGGNLIGITAAFMEGGQNLNFAVAAEDFWR